MRLALKRLRVLEQYTDLGSGFQIAMRDLEIRGAGNILGVRQHGFIAAVGFELYCRLLEEAVQELRGQKPEEKKEQEVSVDIALQAFIPTEYVSDGAARISIYQELSGATTFDHVESAQRELTDRFGPMPRSVYSLLLLMRIKVLARTIGASKVSITSDGILVLAFTGDGAAVRNTVKTIFSKAKTEFEIVNGPPLLLKAALSAADVEERARQAKDILYTIAQ